MYNVQKAECKYFVAQTFAIDMAKGTGNGCVSNIMCIYRYKIQSPENSHFQNQKPKPKKKLIFL